MVNGQLFDSCSSQHATAWNFCMKTYMQQWGVFMSFTSPCSTVPAYGRVSGGPSTETWHRLQPQRREQGWGGERGRENVHDCGLPSLQLKGNSQSVSAAYFTHAHTFSTHTEAYSGFPAGCPDEVWWRRTRTALWLNLMVCSSPKICWGGGRSVGLGKGGKVEE